MLVSCRPEMLRIERLQPHFGRVHDAVSSWGSLAMFKVNRNAPSRESGLPNKPLVPTRNGEAPLLAARRRR